MLCHYHLLVCLSCFVTNCWSSTSEYLIIRHGRSRVRHSSEKDHIRWGLQVFDNFTLLDYDTVDDSNETGSTGNTGGELRPPKKPDLGRVGLDQFSDSSNNSNTLLIQINESEQLDRMIDISDFDSISIASGGSTSIGRKQPPSLRSSNRTANVPFHVVSNQQSTPSLVDSEQKDRENLTKKEIMENIKKSVDKGLEYLESHKNLDEVKIELKPSRARTKGNKDDERLAHSFGTASADQHTLLGKVIPSHDGSKGKKKTVPKHVDGNRKDYTPMSSPFSNLFTGGTADNQRQNAESDLPTSAYLGERYWKSVQMNNDDSFFRSSTVSTERKQISTETTGSSDNYDYPNGPSLVAVDDLRNGFASPALTNEAGSLGWSDKKSEPIKSKTNGGNNTKVKFNYEQRKQSFDSNSTVSFQKDGPPVAESDEVINILNESPTMSFEQSEGDAPSTIIFNSDVDSDLDEPLTWVPGDGSNNVPDMGEIFRTEDIDLGELDETSRNNRRNLMKGRDVVTKFLQIVESQHLLGSNCTAGTALNLGEGVVDRYAQDRFRVEAEIAVNRANMLTRMPTGEC